MITEDWTRKELARLAWELPRLSFDQAWAIQDACKVKRGWTREEAMEIKELYVNAETYMQLVDRVIVWLDNANITDFSVLLGIETLAFLCLIRAGYHNPNEFYEVHPQYKA